MNQDPTFPVHVNGEGNATVSGQVKLSKLQVKLSKLQVKLSKLQVKLSKLQVKLSKLQA